ncbi:diacylglycerol--inositol 3-phosphatidyltransferase [Seminavis robusta]|uniref:Diacylglycerol--inositol 3-phosphatidyltransferase n=1 Tax=Seminavis robusta TaxID=568900 RepID=A0A9N8D617_9STRA|nr:diacylglycerol--inositol 3-phosphatidyltransferase [Seminavis robusta]|eukprot:Sro13_g010280.1 diacylglycerol--inositol 3-phosphatidyltransferase (230) ;mRNA; r:169987-170676
MSSSSTSTTPRSSLPVFLYIPNLLGYARIVLSFYAMYLSDRFPRQTVVVFTLSGSLDLFDGMLARALNQTSSLGVLVDIAADNIMRTCSWMAAASCPDASAGLKTVASIIVCVEWMTMLATQLHAGVHGQHWKESREHDPWLVRALFANNFRNPIGILSIYGLFTANLFSYGYHHPAELRDTVPFFYAFFYLAYVGRALSLVVELWMIRNYLVLVVAKDTQQQHAEKKD